MTTATATAVAASRSLRIPLKYVADAEVGTAAFAANSVIQANGPERCPDPDTQPDADFWTEPGLGKSLQVYICVVSAPGVADVHEEDAFQPARERLAQLYRAQKHIFAPEPIFTITTQRFGSADEELLEEGQRSQRGSCQETQRNRTFFIRQVLPAALQAQILPQLQRTFAKTNAARNRLRKWQPVSAEYLVEIGVAGLQADILVAARYGIEDEIARISLQRAAHRIDWAVLKDFRVRAR